LHRSKKRRTSESVEIEDRLESLILRVGEKVSGRFGKSRVSKQAA
jgi:hypothetical protein